LPKPFVHLHLHTQYSLLDGANKIPEIVKKAHSLDMPAIAMTDHGNMHAAVEFYTAAKKVGIKPIIGCEVYLNPLSRHERKPKEKGGAPTHHLTLLASNKEGYTNLCHLVSLAYREGFYFKPRIDHELLQRYNKGIIVLSGCLAGELNRAVEGDNEEQAIKVARFHQEIFGERYYLEIQPHAVKDQLKLNNANYELSKRLGIPLVATNDCHYPNVDDHYAQEVLMCVSTGKTVTDPTRLRHVGVQLHLKTGDEMLDGFGTSPWGEEAVRNAVEIGKMCDFEVETGKYYMPKYPVPDGVKLIETMTQQARAGLEKRLDAIRARNKSWKESDAQTYYDRLELELKLIDKMGFPGYFLVVSDFIIWAKENGIPVGPGRGSCAGSLVAYAMRITDVDPIEHKLLFERFLNPERVSMPDIDVDFCINGRDKVIKYVVGKYGKENVAQIATFGTLKAKAAIKDVGRALGISYAITDKIASLVPAPRQGFDYPISEAMKMEPKLKEYAEGEGKELISLALKLEGLTRHSSTHAAGVVIADRPLMELLPMMVDKDGNDVTQYSMTYVEKIGLVKFDFLGLKTLTMINTALDLIEASTGQRVNLEMIPLNDAKTFDLLQAGNTVGVFQLESGGITEMTMRLKPNCFNDVVATIALYRPGPLDAGMVDHYIERKHGREPVTYLHPLMSKDLADTYGIMLYQEQIMQMARSLAGYSLGEADILRKAMGKKNPEEMAKQRVRFLKGCEDNKIDSKLSNEIFDQMETFARYGFNRSHSVAYAMISYYTAYLKAHHPVEFMAALMSHEMDDSDKTLKNFTECRKQKIAVLGPHLNESGAGFTVKDGRIRFGLEAVGGVGQKAVEAIIQERNSGGPFNAVEELLERVDASHLNMRVLENLNRAGAFDYTGLSRREMDEALAQLLESAQSKQKREGGNQMSLFSAFGIQPSAASKRRWVGKAEWPVIKKLQLEREAIGFYISGHPLERYKDDLAKLGIGAISDEKERAGLGKHAAKLAGVVTALKLKNTKKGDRYASFSLEDYSGTIESLVWPDTYKQVEAQLLSDDPVVAVGKLDRNEERCVFIIEKVESLLEIRNRSVTAAVIALGDQDDFEARLPALFQVLRKYPGNCPVRAKLKLDGAEVSVVLRDAAAPILIAPSEPLCEEVEQLFGASKMSFL
jgi:DNA polymerase-3 subunit alpha